MRINSAGTRRFLFWVMCLTNCSQSFLIQTRIPTRNRASISLASSKGNNWSSRDRERREEDNRRQQRKDDVVIGKTSAVASAENYALDVSATEEEWMRQATSLEQQIYRLTDTGMEHLKMLRVEEAAEAFDQVFELKPDAYLWQAGIAQYYLGDPKKAADILSRCAQLYENRFGEPASEERIWRYACEMKLNSSFNKQGKKNSRNPNYSVELAQLPQNEHTEKLVASEMRKVFRISRELFQAGVQDDDLLSVISKAKLRSIGGVPEPPDRKQWKLNSWFYLGLYYDAVGEIDDSKACMKRAVRLSSQNGIDIIHTLPMLHMSRRDWFDDDEMEDDAISSVERDTSLPLSDGTSNAASIDWEKLDPVFVESIKTGLEKMTYVDLKVALKKRGLTVLGQKSELIDRLFYSILADSGFPS